MDSLQALAEGVAARYDFSDKATVSLLSVSENHVFLVDDPGFPRKHVIRINSGRLAYHTAAMIGSEMAWLSALRRDTDVVVPDILAARDESLVQTLCADGMETPRHAVVYSFLPGEEPTENDLPSGFNRLGEISARMHQYAKMWSPPDNFTRPSWLPDNILDNRLNWGSWRQGVNVKSETLTLLTRLEGVVRRRLSSLPRDRERFGLIHADLRLANLLISDNCTSVIDFDDCGFGWYLFDFATALSFLEQREDVDELTQCWLEGYRKIANIPNDMLAELQSLIMLRRLQLMGWVGYQCDRIDFAREIGPDFTTDSCRLAEEYLLEFA